MNARFGFLAVLGLLPFAVACSDADTDSEAAAAQSADVTTDDPAIAKDDRVAAESSVWGRKVRLHLSDAHNAGWASIDEGDAGDEAWLDRSTDGGLTWSSGSKLGKTKIPSGQRGWRTLMFGIDDAGKHEVGALRACGKAGNRSEVTCTPWFRTKVGTATPVEAAATALMQMYDVRKGTWRNAGWWNSANALTAMLDYEQATGETASRWAIANTFEKNDGDGFTNDYMDDTAWWGLAWVRAYDVTGERRYLDMARRDADYLWSYKDGTCGGGIWWSAEKKYKNAITNELFIKLAAAIHNRLGASDTTYGARADEIWRWFDASGMINAQHLVNDGLDNSCKNNGGTTWTYNQGVILGGLVELAKAKDDASLLDRAKTLADASSADGGLNPGGVLREPCESSADHCGKDGPSFKGIYARNLGELDRALSGRPYRAYLQRQTAAITSSHTTLGQVGVAWGGPVDSIDPSRQHSALDALVAAR